MGADPQTPDFMYLYVFVVIYINYLMLRVSHSFRFFFFFVFLRTMELVSVLWAALAAVFSWFAFLRRPPGPTIACRVKYIFRTVLRRHDDVDQQDQKIGTVKLLPHCGAPPSVFRSGRMYRSPFPSSRACVVLIALRPKRRAAILHELPRPGTFAVC